MTQPKIAASELRLNNWVRVKDKRNEYFKENYVVTDIFGPSGLITLKEVKSGFVKHRYPIIYIDPIPLDENVLLKCLQPCSGTFSWPSFNPEKSYHNFYIGNVTLKKTYGAADNVYTGFFTYSCNEYNEEADLFTIEFVHELQNVYKLLTGEELKIEL